MPKKDISIVIPCFNCAETLEEAVESCYVQGLRNFEIIMVDDWSTDSTKTVMKELANKHSEIKIFYHDKNRGGGATRNTAVSHTSAEIIFCLDSDDILPQDTLSRMFKFMNEKKCDGVGIHKSIKFRGRNTNDIERVDIFSFAGEKIPFESLLQKDGIMCPLYSTFMHTKRAFVIAGGYPTEHGFDTQGFAWRFLASGLVAYTCPEASYLHRVQYKKSYYIRESDSGKINYNWQDILSEHLSLFNAEAQNFILKFDCQDFSRNLFEELKKKGNILNENYAAFLTPARKKDKTLFHNRKYIKRASIKGIMMRIKKRTTILFKAGIGMIFTFIKKVDVFINLCKSREWNPFLISAFLFLKIRKVFKVEFNEIDLHTQSEIIDVVIPTVSKDYTLVGEVIESIKENLKHKISNFYIVSQKNKEMLEFCEKHNYVFVDEVSVLGYGKDFINYVVNGKDRSGWIFQQLLKLSGDIFVTQKKYFILDSDTILIKPHSFIKNGKDVFLQSEEWHDQYFRAFKKLFGYSSNNTLSYTAHMMIFDCERLKEMKKRIGDLHGATWDKVYLSTIDQKEPSCVSDYDTYANWMKRNYPSEICFTPFYNTALPREKLLPLSALTKQYANKYKSISFHHYKNEKPENMMVNAIR
ncbi:MAG: glycosyltransferase family 2 protein [Candidatus Yonathbacteria bacterium]|nr:glycosyltransferase family 2 protein [Candidatus Yonathbacteria bacterium]